MSERSTVHQGSSPSLSSSSATSSSGAAVNNNGTHTNTIMTATTSWSQPIHSSKLYFSELSRIFSSKFVCWLAINNGLIRGGASAICMSLYLPVFKGLGMDAARQQLYYTMVCVPWAMKPFIGVMSDLFPTMGYNKRYVALVAIIIGLLGCLSLLCIYYFSQFDNVASSTMKHLADLIAICFTAQEYGKNGLTILNNSLHPFLNILYDICITQRL
jgi:spore maturation protein SpmB